VQPNVAADLKSTSPCQLSVETPHPQCRFTEFTLKEMLVFLQVIVKFTLNLNMSNLSIISHFLKHTFQNQRVGNAICKDLQRGLEVSQKLLKLERWSPEGR